MKIAAFLSLAASAAAFAPAGQSSNKVGALNSVFDDYVGAVDFRGKKFEYDPVSKVCSCLNECFLMSLSFGMKSY